MAGKALDKLSATGALPANLAALGSAALSSGNLAALGSAAQSALSSGALPAALGSAAQAALSSGALPAALGSAAQSALGSANLGALGSAAQSALGSANLGALAGAAQSAMGTIDAGTSSAKGMLAAAKEIGETGKLPAAIEAFVPPQLRGILQDNIKSGKLSEAVASLSSALDKHGSLSGALKASIIESIGKHAEGGPPPPSGELGAAMGKLKIGSVGDKEHVTWEAEIRALLVGFGSKPVEGSGDVVYSDDERAAIEAKVKAYAEGLPDGSDQKKFAMSYLASGSIFKPVGLPAVGQLPGGLSAGLSAVLPTGAMPVGAMGQAGGPSAGGPSAGGPSAGGPPAGLPQGLGGLLGGLPGGDLLGSPAQAAGHPTDAVMQHAMVRITDLARAEVPPIHLGIGVLLLSCIFVYGWSGGRDNATDACTDEIGCDAASIMATMAVATLQLWLLALMLVFIMFVVEVVVVGVIRRPTNETLADIMTDVTSGTALIDQGVGMLGLRIMFSWLLDPRMLLAIGASFVCAGAFACVYLAWLGLDDKATRDDYRAAAQNTYAFQLVAFFAFIVAQFWIKAWWADGVRLHKSV